MKSADLDIKLVKHQLIFRFLAKTSRDELKTKDTNYIILKNSKGQTGIGECSIIPGLSVEKPEDLKIKLEELIKNPRILSDYYDYYADFPAIRFGIETALLDLKEGGRRTLFNTKFAVQEEPIPINGLVWMGDTEFMRTQINEKIEAGFSCIKLKIGALKFDQELDILAEIRGNYSPEDIEIRVDANGAFHPNEALDKLTQLSAYKLHSIEQPIAQGHWKKMGELCQLSPLNIALDEELIGIKDISKKRSLLETIMPQYIILKPSLIGGFKACEEWISTAKDLGISYWITSALESNIGLNAICQWTSSLENDLPQGLGTGGLYSNNLMSPLEIENGQIYYRQNQDWNLSILDL